MSKPSYVLTEKGLNKVESALVELYGQSLSKELIAKDAHLHSDTIKKILDRTGGVNLDTLERLGLFFDWYLELDLIENVHYVLFHKQRVSISDPSGSPLEEAPRDPMLQRTLRNRYTITELLSSDKFSETYLAEDRDLLGNPQCVVKRLRRQSSEPVTRVFKREVSVLSLLGSHNQIPSLLARFEEEGDFYLVHELFEGHALSKELIEGQQWSEPKIIALLQEILEIVVFVHQHNVIHRDINPQNLIRRSLDGKIVLTNFASVTQINTGQTRTYTSTHYYTSPEQAVGTPRLCSDVYAVGILNIQALTGLHPRQFRTDFTTGDIVWRDKAQVSPELADILDNMVRYNFTARYPSAAEALKALQGLGTLD